MKKISIYTLALVSAFVFTSCSDNRKEDTPPVETKVDTPQVTTEKKTTVTQPAQQTTVTTTTTKTNPSTVEIGPNGVKVSDKKTNIVVNKNGVSTTTKKGSEIKVSSKTGVKVSF